MLQNKDEMKTFLDKNTKYIKESDNNNPVYETAKETLMYKKKKKSILDIWIRIIFILKGVIRFALYHMNVF